MALGFGYSLCDFQSKTHAGMLQLHGDGLRGIVVKPKFDELPAVLQQIGRQVFAPYGTNQYYARQFQETMDGQWPQARAWSTKIVATNNDKTHLTRLQEPHVPDQLFNLMVFLKSMNPDHLSAASNVPSRSPHLRRFACTGRTSDEYVTSLLKSNLDGSTRYRADDVEVRTDMSGKGVDALQEHGQSGARPCCIISDFTNSRAQRRIKPLHVDNFVDVRHQYIEIADPPPARRVDRGQPLVRRNLR